MNGTIKFVFDSGDSDINTIEVNRCTIIDCSTFFRRKKHLLIKEKIVIKPYF